MKLLLTFDFINKNCLWIELYLYVAKIFQILLEYLDYKHSSRIRSGRNNPLGKFFFFEHFIFFLKNFKIFQLQLTYDIILIIY